MVFVRGAAVVSVHVLVLEQCVAARVATNVDVTVQSRRYRSWWMYWVAVTALHRYLLLRDVSSQRVLTRIVGFDPWIEPRGTRLDRL